MLIYFDARNAWVLTTASGIKCIQELLGNQVIWFSKRKVIGQLPIKEKKKTGGP